MNVDPLTYEKLMTARKAAYKDDNENAFKLYLIAIKHNPLVKRIAEFEFRIVLIKLVKQYSLQEETKKHIFSRYHDAVRVYPGNVNLLSDLGQYLLQENFLCESILHFERALQIDSSLVTIEKKINRSKRIIFPPALFRLLNDKRRNRAYVKAIREVVMPNAECVLDIDTGIGLSALYASAGAAVSTAACESSPNLAKLAERILVDNKAQNVVIINKPANKLDLNDVYGERTMLIINKFDAGLFGDQLLKSLKHSWENLLSEFSRVMPGRAEYYVVGAKSDSVAMKYQLGPAAKKLLNVPDLNAHVEPAAEVTYCGEDINLYDDIEYVTDPQMLLTIDFNNYDDIIKSLKSPKPLNAYIKASKDTEVNVIVGWFKLHLTDDVILTTDPRCGDATEAWQQAVFTDFVPTRLKEQEAICVPFGIIKGKLNYLPDPNREIMRLSSNAIAFLNDSAYMDAIAACVSNATIRLTQIFDFSELEIADLAPFPLFGMLMMKRGAKKLLCILREECDKTFMEHVFAENGVPLTNVTILVADYWNMTIFNDKTFHAVFCSALDPSGDIDVDLSRITRNLEYTRLAKGGLMIPGKVAVLGQLISSEQLDRENRMSEEGSASFRLASQVNLFQTTQANYVDPTRLEYEVLCEPVVLSDSWLTMKAGVDSVAVTRDGVCHALLCWYEMVLMAGMDAMSTARRGSFVRSAAFLAKPPLRVSVGDSVSLIRCVDSDGSYKVVIDLDLG